GCHGQGVQCTQVGLVLERAAQKHEAEPSAVVDVDTPIAAACCGITARPPIVHLARQGTDTSLRVVVDVRMVGQRHRDGGNRYPRDLCNITQANRLLTYLLHGAPQNARMLRPPLSALQKKGWK